MSAKPPAQAAYEAFQRAFPLEDWGPWDVLEESTHAHWDGIAQAAIAAAFPPSVAALAAAIRERDQLQAERDQLRTARDEYRDNAILHIRERDEARGQLAAADRATAEFRRQCSELAGELGATHAVLAEILPRFLANGHGSLSAIAGPGEVAEWRQRAGIEDGQ